LRWARSRPDVHLVAALPRYHPWWAHWVVSVPLLREVVSWNLVLVLRKCAADRPEPGVGNRATGE
jgi:hypothetical protein